MIDNGNGAVAFDSTTPHNDLNGYEDTNTAANGKPLLKVVIQPNTDLNDLDNTLSQKWDETVETPKKQFSQEIFDHSPLMLREACEVLTDATEREVFYVSALGVISGILPNVKGHYRGSEVEANLYAYIIAAYGEGKSAMEYARKLGLAIHKEKKEITNQFRLEHEQEMMQFNKDLKAFQNDKKGTVEPPVKPTPPPNKKLFIAANSSKTGVLQLIHENNGRAILFETEGDTVADTMKQEYGNFSDILRNAYHHQQISYFRRSNSEDVEIERPYISVILSSTFDQLLNLIPNIENGLFSRFLYYEAPSNPNFDNVFDDRKSQYSQYFETLGKRFQDLYNILSRRESPLWFELLPHQREAFLDVFQERKGELREYVSDRLGGSVNRLGIMCFRIAMILSTLRAYESGGLPNRIMCQDTDFKNALDITEALTKHMISVFWKLPNPKNINKERDLDSDTKKVEQKKLCKDLHSKGMSYRQISLQVLGSKTQHQTVYRWIHS